MYCNNYLFLFQSQCFVKPWAGNSLTESEMYLHYSQTLSGNIDKVQDTASGSTKIKRWIWKLCQDLKMKIKRNNIAGNGWLSHQTNLPHAMANKVVISQNETAVLWRRITLWLVAPSLCTDWEFIDTREQLFIVLQTEAECWVGTMCGLEEKCFWA